MNIEIIEENGELKIYFPHDKNISEIKEILERIKNNEIEVVRTDRLSIDQAKLIWVLCREYGELVGYDKEEMREVLQNEFCSKKGLEYFSISTMKKDSCSKETATEFIPFIIEHSIEQGFNLLIYEGYGENRKVKGAREVVPSIQRYELACIRSKTCAKCGARHGVTIHHHDTIASTVSNYDKDDGLQGRMMALCVKCHSLAHAISKKDFENLYHLQGVFLTPSIVYEIKPLYPSHFKAFKKENYIKDIDFKK